MSHFETPSVVGLIGDPVAHSQSPALHHALYARARLPLVYVPIRMTKSQLRHLPLLMRMADIIGLNVTAPHKQAVVPLLARLDPLAALTGAVNTIHATRRGLTGYNTDVVGFTQALQTEWSLSPRGLPVVILGTGGAARACAVACLRSRCRTLTIAGRHAPRTRYLVRQLSAHFPAIPIQPADLTFPTLRQLRGSATLVVQATSAPERMAALLQRACARSTGPAAAAYYYDCCYWSPVARTLSPHFHIATGHSMLRAQAIASIKLWTGVQVESA